MAHVHVSDISGNWVRTSVVAREGSVSSSRLFLGGFQWSRQGWGWNVTIKGGRLLLVPPKLMVPLAVLSSSMDDV